MMCGSDRLNFAQLCARFVNDELSMLSCTRPARMAQRFRGTEVRGQSKRTGSATICALVIKINGDLRTITVFRSSRSRVCKSKLFLTFGPFCG
uniref:Uncharacterized protein n=1 Tax=Trichuris muris TaxID=70415 RepID=A0A5S6QPJ1_TRIMR